MLKKLLSITLITFALFIGGHAMLDTSAEARPSKPCIELTGHYKDSATHRYYLLTKYAGMYDDNYYKATICKEYEDSRGVANPEESTTYNYTIMLKNGEWIYQFDTVYGSETSRGKKWYKVADDRLANDILYAVMHLK